MFLCEKGQGVYDDYKHVSIVSCALANGYADRNNMHISIHDIAAKFYYEGLGCVSKLISDMISHVKNKDNN